MPALSSPYASLLHHAELTGEEPWLFRSEGLDWRWHTWGEIARQAAAWADELAGRPPGSRVEFPYTPSVESIAMDLGIMGAGLVAVPVSGESVPEPEVPLPGPSSPRPSSPAPSQPPSPGEEGALTPPTPSLPASPPPTGREGAQTAPSSHFRQTPPSSPGGPGGRLGEEGRGDEGLGREAGAVVIVDGSPTELSAADLTAMAERIQAEIAPPRRAGEREILVLGGALETPEERAMWAWATVTGAAVALEPSPGLRIATAAWVRPTVFHGTAEEIAALRGWAEKKKMRGLPFGRLRTVLVAGGEIGGEEEAFWREHGVKLGRVPRLAAERHEHGI
ncbi:MAG: hypothetical protein WAM82_15295 [Thermoanaerobaculia bacterium]